MGPLESLEQWKAMRLNLTELLVTLAIGRVGPRIASLLRSIR